MNARMREVDRLYDEVLAPRLRTMESLRLELRGYIVKAGMLVGVPFAMFFLGDTFGGGLGTLVSGLGFALIFVGLIAAVWMYGIPGLTAMVNYRQRFKHEVVAEIFRIVCPSATYAPNEGIPEALFDEPGIFSTRGGVKSDDRVRGRIGQTPFEAAEVSRKYTTGGKNSHTVVVFHGLFFHLDFNKSVRGLTIVQPASARDTQLGSRDGLAEVSLESPDFTREFTVYASDEMEARYILTPSMMEQLLSLREQAGHPVFLAFTRNRAYLGVHYGRSLFEPGIRTTTAKEAIEAMASQFALAETIVAELDLNTRIWTKGVDESLLHRNDEPAPTNALDGLSKQAEAGTLTAAQVWAAATEAVDETADATLAGPQPPGSAIRIERTGGHLSIAYGGLSGFLITIALWLASWPIALSAARTLMDRAQDIGFGPLPGLLQRLPATPVIDGWVASLPIAWLAGAVLMGGITFLLWTTRVRAVEIAPGEVRVRRGLRPWPRRYARPPYNRVKVIGNAVFLQSDAFSFYTPTASPQLSKDEAAWLASEMRRGLSHR